MTNEKKRNKVEVGVITHGPAYFIFNMIYKLYFNEEFAVISFQMLDSALQPMLKDAHNWDNREEILLTLGRRIARENGVAPSIVEIKPTADIIKKLKLNNVTTEWARKLNQLKDDLRERIGKQESIVDEIVGELGTKMKAGRRRSGGKAGGAA